MTVIPTAVESELHGNASRHPDTRVNVRAQAPIGIHGVSPSKQRHGWRAFTHHDVDRAGIDGSTFGRLVLVWQFQRRHGPILTIQHQRAAMVSSEAAGEGKTLT